jgi:hypothetical protein
MMTGKKYKMSKYFSSHPTSTRKEKELKQTTLEILLKSIIRGKQDFLFSAL